MCEDITGRQLDHTYVEDNRIGDHIWWIGSNARFQDHYPEWSLKYDVRTILEEMFDANTERWS